MGEILKTYRFIGPWLLAIVSLMYFNMAAQTSLSGAMQSLPSNLTLTSDTGRISWGERATIELRLGMEMGDGKEGWPVWKDTIPGGLEILSVSPIDTLAPGELDPLEWDMVMEQRWEVTGWDSGFVNIPSVTIGEEVSEPLMLQIVPTRGAELKPPSGIMEIEWSFMERILMALPWIGIVLCVVVVGLLALMGYKKWASREISAKVNKTFTPKIPPHITALKDLKELQNRESWSKGEAKTFHVNLSLIVRTYIDARYHVSSLDKTTRESSEIIKNLDISEGDKTNIISALKLGDHVKFAKHRAESHEHVRSISNCIDFVNNTLELEAEVELEIKEEKDEVDE